MARIKRIASKNKRFVLDDQGEIFDILHPEQGAEHPWYMNPLTHKPFDDEVRLRDGVFVRRLERLVRELSRGNATKKQRNKLTYQMDRVIPGIIQASQLNRRDVRISMQHPFKGKFKRRKTEMCELTSISLFIDDVERLLRDLYGDIDGDDLTEVVAAIKSTVLTLSEYVLPELASEYHTAFDIDYGSGRAVVPGDGVSSVMLVDGVKAAERLILRVWEILLFPSRYSRYTVSFARALNANWPALQEWRPLAKTTREAIGKLAMRSKYLREVA